MNCAVNYITTWSIVNSTTTPNKSRLTSCAYNLLLYLHCESLNITCNINRCNDEITITPMMNTSAKKELPIGSAHYTKNEITIAAMKQWKHNCRKHIQIRTKSIHNLIDLSRIFANAWKTLPIIERCILKNKPQYNYNIIINM